jgi:hypothetical protein
MIAAKRRAGQARIRRRPARAFVRIRTGDETELPFRPYYEQVRRSGGPASDRASAAF